jgi:hypothetical protein
MQDSDCILHALMLRCRIHTFSVIQRSHCFDREVTVHTNRHPSGRPPGRTITIHLTHDTLMLICALIFLISAISLAFIFPSGNTTESVALRATPAIAPITHVPAPAPQIEPSAAPAIPVAQAQPPAYPAPQTANIHADTATGAAAASAVSPAYPAPSAASVAPGADQLIFDPAVQPTEVPAFIAVSPDTPRSPTLPASTVAQPTVAAAPDAKVIPQPAPKPAAPKPAAPVADGAPPAQAAPRPQPETIVRKSQTWDKSVHLGNTYRVAGNATLTINPGVEVHFAPGASLIVEGTLFALGTPERHVRFVGFNGAIWESIVGAPGSNIDLEHVDIQGGGGGGLLLSSDSGVLLIQGGHITRNGGHIVAKNSRVNIQNTIIADNEMPYGAALEVSYSGSRRGFDSFVLRHSRILHNGLSAGTVPLQVINDRPLNTSITLDIDHNLLIGQDGPDLTLIANGLLQGNITCNALVGGANGLSVLSNQPQTFYTMLNIRDNAIEQHNPPLDPFYRENNIGRGASSEIPIKMDANWWGNPLGPYAADRHADGRGDAVGANISFDAWHTTRPDCAPSP